MIVSDQTVESPVTGERLLFRETARDSGGEHTRCEALVAPGGELPRARPRPVRVPDSVTGPFGWPHPQTPGCSMGTAVRCCEPPAMQARHPSERENER
jgi:hypothetical protein